MAALLSGASASLAAQPSLVILVRHAERDTAPRSDPALTPAGTARASDLASALAGVRVGSIIATQYQRTRLTAAPIADALGLAPIIVAASGPIAAHVDAVATAVRARPAGEVVLVVGHSNTIPAIVRALGGPELPDLCESEYSTLLLLHFSGSGTPNLVRAKYGAEAPSGECSPRACCPGIRTESGASKALPDTVIPRYVGSAKRESRIGETTDDTERTVAVARAIIAERNVSHVSIGALWRPRVSAGGRFVRRC